VEVCDPMAYKQFELTCINKPWDLNIPKLFDHDV
jgi:hypothetical protein